MLQNKQLSNNHKDNNNNNNSKRNNIKNRTSAIAITSEVQQIILAEMNTYFRLILTH